MILHLEPSLTASDKLILGLLGLHSINWRDPSSRDFDIISYMTSLFKVTSTFLTCGDWGWVWCMIFFNSIPPEPSSTSSDKHMLGLLVYEPFGRRDISSKGADVTLFLTFLPKIDFLLAFSGWGWVWCMSLSMNIHLEPLSVPSDKSILGLLDLEAGSWNGWNDTSSKGSDIILFLTFLSKVIFTLLILGWLGWLWYMNMFKSIHSEPSSTSGDKSVLELIGLEAFGWHDLSPKDSDIMSFLLVISQVNFTLLILTGWSWASCMCSYTLSHCEISEFRLIPTLLQWYPYVVLIMLGNDLISFWVSIQTWCQLEHHTHP